MIYLLNRRDNELMWLAGGSLSIAVRALLLNKFLVYAMVSDVPWVLLMHLQFIAKFMAIFMYIQLIRTLYRQDVNDLIHKICTVGCLLAVLYVAIVPPSVSTLTINLQTNNDCGCA
jgi:hypothetical protein